MISRGLGIDMDDNSWRLFCWFSRLPGFARTLLARESELARSLTCPKHPVMKVTVSVASPNLIWSEVVFMAPPPEY